VINTSDVRKSFWRPLEAVEAAREPQNKKLPILTYYFPSVGDNIGS
jgi:hypothetical protein